MSDTTQQRKVGDVLVIILCSLVLIAFTSHLFLPLQIKPASTSSSESKDVSAFYQSSGLNLRVVEAVLHNFRVFYPLPPLNAWFYGSAHPSPEVISYAHFYSASVFSGALHTTNATFFTDAGAAEAYWSRLASTAHPSGWVLVLEDDIWLYARVDLKNLKYTLNAPCAALFRPGVWALLSRLPASNKRQLCYALLGGSLISASAFVSSENIFQELLDAGGGFISRDELVSALVVAGGGNIGPYSGFSETWWQWGNVILRARRFW